MFTYIEESPLTLAEVAKHWCLEHQQHQGNGAAVLAELEIAWWRAHLHVVEAFRRARNPIAAGAHRTVELAFRRYDLAEINAFMTQVHAHFRRGGG